MQKRNNTKLLFILTGLIVSLLMLNNSAFAATKLIIEKSFDVNPGEKLEMSVAPGDIIIDTWDRDEVKVYVYANGRAEEEIEFTLEKTSYGVLIKTEKENQSWSFWNSIKVKFEVKIPANFNVSLKTAGGDIKLSDLMGKAEIKTSGGDIIVKNSEGEFECATSGGDIKVNSHKGNIQLKTSGGDIVTGKIEGNLDASTSGGDIKVEVAGGMVKAGTSGGDVTAIVTGGFQGAVLKTSGGDIDLYVPSGISADLECRTSGGDVDVNVPGARPTYEKKSRYEGTVNGGGSKIVCKTSGGNIQVKAR